MTEPLPLRGAHFVQSLERGLAVIRAFSAERPQLTLSEVARATGLDRAAARRFLLTLADLGYVHSDGRSFMLAPRVLELGYAYLSSISLPGLRGVDGPRAARRPARRRARRAAGRDAARAADPPLEDHPRGAARGAAARARPGLGARGPGARGGPAFGGRADPRPPRRRRGRDQRVRARRAADDRLDAPRAGAQAAGHGRTHRGRPRGAGIGAARPGRPRTLSRGPAPTHHNAAPPRPGRRPPVR